MHENTNASFFKGVETAEFIAVLQGITKNGESGSKYSTIDVVDK